MKTPKEKTAVEFFGTDDLRLQLLYIVNHSAWAVPSHLIEGVCWRVLAEHLANGSAVNPRLDSMP